MATSSEPSVESLHDGRDHFIAKWPGFLALFAAAGVKLPKEAERAVDAYNYALTIWIGLPDSERRVARDMSNATRRDVRNFVMGADDFEPYVRQFVAAATDEQFAKFKKYNEFFAVCMDLS